ncbi:hypothetical protein [Candidatus Thiosymbion oneisti]|uniref:hypothetical protein n=1 Tax=Candidatus Thiosymbion oneisti TaxID=589554 RepID=UPI0013FDEE62|nr:hypothetical protein [Candidatus Thiosymbion oneisti]
MTNGTGYYVPSPAGRGDQKDESLYFFTYKFTTTKEKYPDDLEQETRFRLVRLKQKDPDAYKRLLDEHREG